jgi:hypothetical protein
VLPNKNPADFRGVVDEQRGPPVRATQRHNVTEALSRLQQDFERLRVYAQRYRLVGSGRTPVGCNR